MDELWSNKGETIKQRDNYIGKIDIVEGAS
jgi:hypothetical protein